MKRFKSSVMFFLLFLILPRFVEAAERLKLATTTSTANSGLLAYLHPVFEKKVGIRVHSIVVGTGKALKLGQNGDVDVVLVHARQAEDSFVKSGYGVNRKDVMYNDFVIVGPSLDSAEIRGLTDVVLALKHIAMKPFLWFSRGDDSGTHKKEMILWQQSGVKPEGKWYWSLGQGMGKTLLAADEKQAYTLTDRGTFIALAKRDKIQLQILTEGDPRLFNPYGVIAVNPVKHPHVNYKLAMQYITFLTSPLGQEMIGNYRMKGKILFHPQNGS